MTIATALRTKPGDVWESKATGAHLVVLSIESDGVVLLDGGNRRRLTNRARLADDYRQVERAPIVNGPPPRVSCPSLMPCRNRARCLSINVCQRAAS